MGLPGPVALQKNHHASLTPLHTWLPLCPKAYFPIRYGPEPGKGGTTVYSVVRGYGEMGVGVSDSVCVGECERRARDTQEGQMHDYQWLSSGHSQPMS